MVKKAVLTLVVAALVCGAVPLVAQNQGPLAGIRDQWEMGCVSCHSTAVMGETLNVTLSNMDHPSVTRSVTTLPDGCTMCHRDGSLGPMVHKNHYPRNQASAPSMPCLACHSMNRSTGVPENKSAPKNW